MDDLVVGRINFSPTYESPIEKIVGQIQTQMAKNDEENIMVQVQQAIGYKIDKEELIKALQYDRQQYEKGYADAMSVIEDIRAEIDEQYDIVKRDNIYCVEGLEMALGIIDKHLSGKESTNG